MTRTGRQFAIIRPPLTSASPAGGSRSRPVGLQDNRHHHYRLTCIQAPDRFRTQQVRNRANKRGISSPQLLFATPRGPGCRWRPVGFRSNRLTCPSTQRYCCVMLPDADLSTGYLPPGVHDAPWNEIAQRFSANGHRILLVGGLLAALTNLAGAGCRSVLLDGSFVSQKDLPDDYDGAWDIRGVDPYRLDPVLLDFANGRAAMKSKYFGELFPATALAAPGVLYRDFFMKDRNGVPKGIININLGSLP